MFTKFYYKMTQTAIGILTSAGASCQITTTVTAGSIPVIISLPDWICSCLTTTYKVTHAASAFTYIRKHMYIQTGLYTGASC